MWAVLGAVCGGLYAYYTEHLLTKDELKRIGGHLPGNSSAIVAFVRGPDPRRVLSAIAAYQPATASVAAVTADLSAQVTAVPHSRWRPRPPRPTRHRRRPRTRQPS